MIKRVLKIFFYTMSIIYFTISFIFILNTIIFEDFSITLLTDNLSQTIIFITITMLGYISLIVGSLFK